jgi:SAM-dependent methyltransferase
MENNSFLATNRATWDRYAKRGVRFATPATDEECLRPLETLDGRGWLPASVAGLKVLCLAAGGGWQSILYASAGANVTVVDLSPEMLKRDVQEAERRRLSVQVFEGSMDNLSMLAEESFDIVHQPVSTCYVPDILAVYDQVARVLRDGGLYISQHKQPTSLQIVERDAHERYVIGVGYYQNGPLPPVGDDSYREPGATEFLHRWEDLVGGLCRAGFLLEDLREPRRGDAQAPPGHFGHRGLYIPPYVRMKARRLPRERASQAPGKIPAIWTP